MTNFTLINHLSKTLFGTEGKDWFDAGGAGLGETLKMLGGDDYYTNVRDGVEVASGGGRILAGAGNDIIDIRGILASSVYDGEGHDQVSLDFGVIHAALDGENDYFASNWGRVSYEAATEGLLVRNGFVTSLQVGTDEVRSRELIGGSGDDIIEGYDFITGGAGDDVLAPIVRASGGLGDDHLIANNPFSRIELRGEAGDDTFHFWTDASVSGGAGADRFVFEAVTQATINDLKIDDRIDVSQILDMTIADAFQDGYLKTSISKGYTYGFIDTDGGGNDLVQLFAVKGVYSNIDDYLI